VLRARCDAGAAGILVTHEPRYAAYADRTVFLRDGRIVDETGSGARRETVRVSAALDSAPLRPAAAGAGE
jgi:putative ABC transport system ATP-binding protein